MQAEACAGPPFVLPPVSGREVQAFKGRYCRQKRWRPDENEGGREADVRREADRRRKDKKDKEDKKTHGQMDKRAKKLQPQRWNACFFPAWRSTIGDIQAPAGRIVSGYGRADYHCRKDSALWGRKGVKPDDKSWHCRLRHDCVGRGPV